MNERLIRKMTGAVCDMEDRNELVDVATKLFSPNYNLTKAEHDFTEDNKSICDEAPYPNCNGAIGCDTCPERPEDET